jgi:CDP-6-deoxy-D-xylo-4-hexulose-3-dehydrase
MVMFNNEKHLNRAIMFRDWGRIGNNIEDMSERFNYKVDDIPYDFKFLYGCLGYNFKSSEVNAAFGLIQMDRLPKFLEIRRKNVERYIENLKDISEVLLPDDSKQSNWLAFPIQINNRLELAKYLEEKDVQIRVIFSGNITRHPVYREFLEPFTNCDIIMRDGLLLGCHHGMSLEDVDHVCSLIKEFLKSS